MCFDLSKLTRQNGVQSPHRDERFLGDGSLHRSESEKRGVRTLVPMEGSKFGRFVEYVHDFTS